MNVGYNGMLRTLTRYLPTLRASFLSVNPHPHLCLRPHVRQIIIRAHMSNPTKKARLAVEEDGHTPTEIYVQCRCKNITLHAESRMESFLSCRDLSEKSTKGIVELMVQVSSISPLSTLDEFFANLSSVDVMDKEFKECISSWFRNGTCDRKAIVSCRNCGSHVLEFAGGKQIRTFVSNIVVDNIQEDMMLDSSFKPRFRTGSDSLIPALPAIPSFKEDCLTPQSSGDFLRYIAPKLDFTGRKGDGGRICIFGGSVDYTGAPYYAGMAALRAGAELLYLCTAEEATGPIKSYSPELMVTPVYKHSTIVDLDANEYIPKEIAENVFQKVKMAEVLVIGPGLGRNSTIVLATKELIGRCNEINKPCVIDADGLWVLNSHPQIVKKYSNCILTPNKREFDRLCKALHIPVGVDTAAATRALCSELQGPAIVLKGAKDYIASWDSDAGEVSLSTVTVRGAPRRPGGLGDFLAGTIATVVNWSIRAASKKDKKSNAFPIFIRSGCEVACTLVRHAAANAFAEKKRGMVAPDVLDKLDDAVDSMAPDD